jgi:hypothetical protein
MYPKVIPISLGGPRTWLLPAGKALALFDPAQPGITVTTMFGPTIADTDELQDVLWFDKGGELADPSRWPVPGGFHPSTGKKGAFARISNGPNVGLLFLTAQAEDTTGLNFGPMPARGRGRAASATAFQQGFDEAKGKAVTELEQATEKVRSLGAG